MTKNGTKKLSNPRGDQRRAAGFETQLELCKFTGFHPSTIGGIESGRLAEPPWWYALMQTRIQLLKSREENEKLKKKVINLQKLIGV